MASCSTIEEPQNTGPNDPQNEQKEEFSTTKIKDFPFEGRTGAFSFTLGGKIYMGTGFGSNSTYFGDFWEYNPNTDSWTEKASFPIGPFIGGNTFVYQGKGYVIAGTTLKCQLNTPCTYTYHSAIHAYDPITNSWEKIGELPQFKGNNSGPSITVEGNKAILFWDYQSFEIDLQDYQITQKSNAPGSLIYSASFKIGNKIYVSCPMISGKGTKAVFSYDISTGNWETLPDFPGIKRYLAQGFSYNGHGYLIGGKESDVYGEDKQFKEIWRFDPANQSWKMIGTYPGAAYTGQVLQVIGSDVFVGFGDTRSFVSFEKDWWKLKFN
ncbi:MAG: N-acetylneuraminic acid mutarotase [Cyclobacteriaceae bacterium]|nr:N-acetylneuraminic acid mutarotase [Cyclobacteriaceae bacterium]